MPPLVSAIVLNYCTPQHAVRCVQSLLGQTIADKLEILIIDNHSQDDSIGVLRNRLGHIPSVRILEHPKNSGYGAGNTLGIRAANGTYLLIINPDNELKPNALELMVNAMEKDPTIGIAAPKLIQEDGTIRDSYRTFPQIIDLIIKRTFLHNHFPERMRKYLQWDTDPTKIRDVDWVVGACLLMRKDFYLALEGFDLRFFLFFEDTDLCRRCWEAGKRVVYFPAAQGSDRKSRLSEGGVLALLTKQTARIHLVSAMKYFWKWRLGGCL